MRRWGWWSKRTQVERVDFYTRQTLYAMLWAAALLIVLNGSNEASGDSTELLVAAVGALVVTAAATPVLSAVCDLYPATGPIPWRMIAPFLLLTAAYLAVGLTFDDAAHGVVLSMVLVALVVTLGGLRDLRFSIGLVAFLTALPAVAEGEPAYALAGLGIALFIIATIRISLWLLQVVTELDEARGAQAALAVAEERLRFSRDLHDVLGRRLSTIAVKSDLAATLSDRGEPGASAQMIEVRDVAHEALREARELIRGYRAVDLAQELEGARSLLRSAGISVSLDVEELPEGWHEAAAWVVREAVTNVLRHSSATTVTIRYDEPELTVRNDGVGPSSGGGSGSGLAGLRERLAPLGAGLLSARDGDEFVVTATLPGPGPEASS